MTKDSVIRCAAAMVRCTQIWKRPVLGRKDIFLGEDAAENPG